jgi:hypothetical protein
MAQNNQGIDYSSMELNAYLSMQAYQDNGGTAPQGWHVIGDSASMGIGKDTGYYGVAYQNDANSQVIVAHRGTEFDKEFHPDVTVADRQIAFQQVPDQYHDAVKFVEAIGEKANIELASMEHTGHSLGGNIAGLVSIATDARSSVFDAPGNKEQLAQLETIAAVEPGTYVNADYSDKITAYQLDGDIVGSYGTQVGKTFTIENPNLPAQLEDLQELRDDINVAQMVSPADIRPDPLLELQAFQQAAKDALENHSINLLHAVAQDNTAQDRMGPIYGPPTEEQTPEQIPSKAEWAAGDGFHSLESQLNAPAAETSQPNSPAVDQTPEQIPSKAEWAAGDGFHSLESQLNPPAVETNQASDQAAQSSATSSGIANDNEPQAATNSNSNMPTDTPVDVNSSQVNSFATDTSAQNAASNTSPSSLGAQPVTQADGIQQPIQLSRDDESDYQVYLGAFAQNNAGVVVPGNNQNPSEPMSREQWKEYQDYNTIMMAAAAAYAAQEAATPANTNTTPQASAFDASAQNLPTESFVSPPASTANDSSAMASQATLSSETAAANSQNFVSPTQSAPVIDTFTPPSTAPYVNNERVIEVVDSGSSNASAAVSSTPVQESYVAPQLDNTWSQPTVSKPVEEAPQEKSWVGNLFGSETSQPPSANQDSGRGSSWVNHVSESRQEPPQSSWTNHVSQDSGTSQPHSSPDSSSSGHSNDSGHSGGSSLAAGK